MNRQAEQIKARVTVREMFERDGRKIEKSGGQWVCLCPWHKEKHGSCTVYSDHFHCFGCGMHGDVISYIQLTRGCGFKEALEYLGGPEAEKGRPFQYVPVKKEAPKEPEPDWLAMFNHWICQMTNFDFSKRDKLAVELGVSIDSLEALRCVWDGSDWAFPMRNERREIIGFRLRSPEGKKFAVKGSHQGLFIPLQDVPKRVMVCEGPSDTAACLSLDLYAIGRPSCNGCEQIILDFLKINRVREVVLVVDNDKPGIEGARKLRDRLPMKSWELLLPTKDLREYVQNGGGRELIETMLNNQVPRIPK